MTVSTILESCADPQQADDLEDGKSLDDLIFEEEVRLNSLVFDEQSNLAAFYSFVKLREQEIRNIVWMAEMISRKVPKESSLWSKYIVPFADSD
jgi:V-type H+-transporting ATPase subunit d